MPDRLALILELGALATEAAQRGDDRAAAGLRDAVELLVTDAAKDKTLRERRSADAGRQRRHRERNEPNVTECHVTSRESRDGSQGFSPTPPFPNSPTPSRDTARGQDDVLYAESVENLTSLLTSRVGEYWPDIDGFLRRREYTKWQGWMKEMLTILTGGTVMVCDLAQVCRDDEALDRRIGSPKGLRSFAASAARERLHPPSAEPRSERPRGGVANRTFANGRDALRGLP